MKKETVEIDKAQTPRGTQFLDLSSAIANEICHYLENGGLTTKKLQELIKQKTTIKKIARETAHQYLQLVPDEVVAAKELLEKYFLEVLKLKLNLAKVAFPEHEAVKAYMANPPQLNEDQIMEKFADMWGIDVYKWLDPVAKKINRNIEQKRPKGLYVFGHRGGDEPDDVHRNKSYNDAVKEGFPFASAKEYLLMTGFHKFTKDYFMDGDGWTRTSSLWSDGSLVNGDWRGRLELDGGSPYRGSPARGPRELFL